MKLDKLWNELLGDEKGCSNTDGAKLTGFLLVRIIREGHSSLSVCQLFKNVQLALHALVNRRRNKMNLNDC